MFDFNVVELLNLFFYIFQVWFHTQKDPPHPKSQGEKYEVYVKYFYSFIFII